ncbi:Uncharacterized protein Fot_56781 [Forsythia ovata]|uniref:Uncharacterized protein n=1 Tax=Forsythia ovata TaxID=205694 RepID=A0ABD1NY76_9LAMI
MNFVEFLEELQSFCQLTQSIDYINLLRNLSSTKKKRKSPMQRATYEYLRGNILDVFPEYKKDAEDHLSKAKRKSPMQRATYEYLRGNILDVFPEYKKDAEDHLSKAKRKSPMQRATYEYLRGNILDVFPEYKKDAEDHLSKARNLLEEASNNFGKVRQKYQNTEEDARRNYC